MGDKEKDAKSFGMRCKKIQKSTLPSPGSYNTLDAHKSTG
jgi:hypothetical protein